MARSTTNRNRRGSAAQRRRRRAWLVDTFRADVDIRLLGPDRVVPLILNDPAPRGDGLPACRCYRCGTLLHAGTVTVDRIIPGIRGGTYRRNNIRPACGTCNSETGGALGAAIRWGRAVA